MKMEHVRAQYRIAVKNRIRNLLLIRTPSLPKIRRVNRDSVSYIPALKRDLTIRVRISNQFPVFQNRLAYVFNSIVFKIWVPFHRTKVIPWSTSSFVSNLAGNFEEFWSMDHKEMHSICAGNWIGNQNKTGMRKYWPSMIQVNVTIMSRIRVRVSEH